MLFRSLFVVFCLCTLAHAQSSGSTGQAASVDPTLVHPPLPVQTPIAEMPDQARRQHLSGICALNIEIDAKGLPHNMRVVRCSDPIFVQNSLDAAKKYRFQPAKTIDGNKPVPYTMHLEISYRLDSTFDDAFLSQPRIRVGFLVPTKPGSTEPDSTSIYALSHSFDAPNSFPILKRFVNDGFGHAAFFYDDGAGCVVRLKIDENGKPSDAQITKCDGPSLEKSAIQSLLKSQFEPAILNGKAVPIRASVHLVCDGFATPQK